MFSVAPTLGIANVMVVPLRRPGTLQFSRPPSSSITSPSLRSADKWRSIGRGPSSHPPGNDICAAPARAAMAPRKTMEERISRIRLSGTLLWFMPEGSTLTQFFSCSTRQPRQRSMATEARTSDSAGQLVISLVPSAKSVAARIGSAPFLAPWITISPSSLCSPSIISFAMSHTPSSRGDPPPYTDRGRHLRPQSLQNHPMPQGGGW